MKSQYMLLILFVLFLCSCITDEAEMCINALDCEPGHQCINGECIPKEGFFEDNDENDDPYGQNQDDNKEVQPDDNNLVETENDEEHEDVESLPDNETEKPDDEGIDQPDENEVVVECKPDSCSGNGDCSVVGGEIVCSCDDGYAGNDCSECSSGYLKSSVDGKCKPDCVTGDINCLDNMVCKINPDTNEAGCDCKDGYYTSNCMQCEDSYFCSNQGTCYVSNNAATCECHDGYGGVDCSSCADNYIYHNGGCIEGCKNHCGSNMGTTTIDGTIYFIVAKSHGSCEIIQNKATCVCDQGWKSSLEYTIPGQIKPPCSDCDTDDPPPEGCPEE
jgi:hypothetical protein